MTAQTSIRIATSPPRLPATPAEPPALVVFGRDEKGKPHASRFGQADAALAEKAAGLMNMAVLRVGEEHLDLAAQVPKGRVFASGKAFTPFIKAKLYASLEAAAGYDRPGEPTRPGPTSVGSTVGGAGDTPATSPGEPAGGHSAVEPADVAGDAHDAPSGPDNPTVDWGGISPGSVVLATTGNLGEGWFESVVIRAMADDLFELRWRDYDGPSFIRRRRALALLPPAMSPQG